MNIYRKSIIDSFIEPLFLWFSRNLILKLIESKSNQSILDLGCGNGNFIKPLIKKNNVIGLDISDEVVKSAWEKGIFCIKADAHHLPLLADTFDWIVCIGMIQCIKNLPKLFDEMGRVLKENGSIIIHTLNSRSMVRKILKHLVPGSRYLRLYSVDEVSELFCQKGSQLKEIIYDYCPLPLVISKKNPDRINDFLSFSFAIVAKKLCSAEAHVDNSKNNPLEGSENRNFSEGSICATFS